MIDSLAGRGGMGEVYLAHDARLNRRVAIKMLPPEWSNDRASRERFEREARITSSLNHPNLVVLHDIGEHDSGSYFVMEYVNGETLSRRLKRGPLPPHTVARLGAQIADGLASAHGAGLVHRDLKPANVMVTNDDHVKLLDFGLGKWLEPIATATAISSPSPAQPEISRFGEIMGTSAYMSPEQAKGLRIDASSDQFALGVILYEMLSGRHPFSRGSQIQTLNAIIELPAPPLAPDAPPQLTQLIDRCLDKDASARFPTTTDLAKALHDVDDFFRGERASGGLPQGPRPSRRWLPAAAVALALAAVAAGVLSVRWMTRVDGPTPTQIAILPFTSGGGDGPNQALADGLADILSTRLAALEQPGTALRIVPTAMVRQQQGRSAADARRAFGVDTVVLGSLDERGSGLRLTLSLVDAVSTKPITGETLDLATRDVGALQERATGRLLALLNLERVAANRPVGRAAGTQSPGAAEFYLQGRGYLQRYERPENIDSAITLFERALAISPNDGLIHAALAEACWRRYDQTKDATWAVRAQAAGSAALRHNPDLAQVHVTLGILANGTGQYENAVAELKLALAAEPANADAFRELGRAYEFLGNQAEAESVLKAAVTARPGDWSVYNALGSYYFRQRRPADAVTQFERVVQLTPDNVRGFSNLGGAYAQQRDWDRAFAAFEKATTLNPTATTWSNLATTLFRKAQFTEAAAGFERAVELGAKNHQVWFNLASSLSQLPGRERRAAEAYAKAAELGEAERRINPRQASLLARLADCYAHLDDGAKARALAVEAEAIAPKDSNLWLLTAQIFEHLGDRSEALRRVGTALQAGMSLGEIESTRSLDALRKDPAYALLVH